MDRYSDGIISPSQNESDMDVQIAAWVDLQDAMRLRISGLPASHIQRLDRQGIHVAGDPAHPETIVVSRRAVKRRHILAS